jgi:PAS domain S-box-containing protein
MGGAQNAQGAHAQASLATRRREPAPRSGTNPHRARFFNGAAGSSRVRGTDITDLRFGHSRDAGGRTGARAREDTAARDRSRPAHPAWPAALLALLVALPILLFAAALMFELAREKKETVLQELAGRAEVALSMVERELEKQAAAMSILAASMPLDAGEVESFRAAALRALPSMPYLTHFALFDGDGRQLANTLRDFGTPLPHAGEAESIREVARSKRPRFVSHPELRLPLSGEPLLAVRVPALRDGEVRFILSAALDRRLLQNIVESVPLPPGWVATVLDAQGFVLARKAAPAGVIGSQTSAAYRDAVARARSGVVATQFADGTPVEAAYFTSGLTGWTVAVSAPLAALERMWLDDLWIAGAAGVLALLLAIASSLFFAGHVKRRQHAAVVANVRAVEAFKRKEIERERRLAAEAAAATVAQSEGLLKTACDTGGLGIWRTDLNTGEVAANDRCKAHLGFRPDEPLTYERLIGAVHPDDRERMLEARRRALESRADYEAEFRCVWPDGSTRWILAHARPTFSAAGVPEALVGATLDMTERKKTETDLRLTVNELNHRVKNVLATVVSLAQQTGRSARSFAEFTRAFNSRILALARTHDVLVGGAWQAARLAAVVETTLLPYRVGDRIVAAGPDAQLPARQAVALSMALHELATNAVKHGALTAKEGRVEVGWDVRGGRVELSWVETGGPPASDPDHKGFGLRLLERGLARQLEGDVDLDFAPGGLRCRIRFPLAESET